MKTHQKYRFITCLSLLAIANTHAADLNPIEPILVSANKYQEDIQAIPASITVITQEEIASSGAATLNEVIMKLGGVNGRQSLYGGNEYNLDLGGFGDTAAQNMAIVVDGIRLKEGDVGEIRLSGIPIEQVERVEIQKGASSVLYGEGAVGGVINIITKASVASVKNSKGGSVYGGLGSLGTKESRVNGYINEGPLRLNLAGTDFMSDGYRTNSATRNQNALVSGQYVHQAFRVGLNVSYSDFYARTPGALGLSDFHSDPKQALSWYLNDWTAIRTNQYGAFVETDIQGWIFKLSADHRDRNLTFVTYGGAPSKYETQNEYIDLTTRKSFSTSYGKSNLIFGVESIRWNQARSGDNGNVNVNSNNLAFYVKDDFNFKDLGLLLNTGYRFEKIEKSQSAGLYTSPGQLNDSIGGWELGLSKELNISNNVYARVAKGYRLPNADEFNYTSYSAMLLPQTSIDKEIGWKYRSSIYRLNTRLFRSDLNNEIAFDSSVPNAPFPGANVNLDPTRRQGLELDGNYKLGKDVTLYGNVGLRSAAFTAGQYSGKKVPMYPGQVVSLRGDWRFTQNQTIGAVWNWFSEQVIAGDFSNNQSMPSYGTVDLRYSYRMKQIDLALIAKNILDSKYYSYATATGGYSVYPEPGRTVFASAKFNF
jgi:iron complex outermembrane receptor protein